MTVMVMIDDSGMSVSNRASRVVDDVICIVRHRSLLLSVAFSCFALVGCVGLSNYQYRYCRRRKGSSQFLYSLEHPHQQTAGDIKETLPQYWYTIPYKTYIICCVSGVRIWIFPLLVHIIIRS